MLKALKETKTCQRQTFQKQTGKKCLAFSCQIKVWVLLETKCSVGYKMAAFHFEGPYLSSFGELKREPKYVKTETSAKLTVLFLGRKEIIR